jgi:hypothetical protein
MATNKTGPLELTSSDPTTLEKTLPGSYRKAAPESTGSRPLYCKTLLEIERSETVKLVVELVRWDAALPPVVKVYIMVLRRDGALFVLPKSAEIRMSEAKRVAVAIARAFTEYGGAV